MSVPVVIASQATPHEPTPVVQQVEEKKQEASPSDTEPPSIPLSNRELVIFETRSEFGESQVQAIVELIDRESDFDNYAQNPRSSAYGMFQFLDQTWKPYGCTKTSSPIIQTECGLKYIKARYGTPNGALQFHNQNGWY